MSTEFDLLALDAAAKRVGELQCWLRLTVDTITTAEIRQTVADAADALDAADERLTRAYCDHAPQPPPRRRRAAA